MRWRVEPDPFYQLPEKIYQLPLRQRVEDDKLSA
jgi:hypothetical protein